MRNNRKSSGSNRPKSAPKSAGSGMIRIIGGQHRGRKLSVIDAQGLRPTTDRVKETVFNWLMPYIHGSRCLDCFAGSGSLGFEAWSRGAEHVMLIEKNPTAHQQLEANKALLDAQKISIQKGDAIATLTKPPAQPFNIVFIDPPFFKGLLEETLRQLTLGWLAEDALIYIETERDASLDCIPQGFTLLKEKFAGQVRYALYQV
ncbi:16S rRNA (guanine(966)-N(2))-methyltransferase RsmD [Thalassotalea fusca]